MPQRNAESSKTLQMWKPNTASCDSVRTGLATVLCFSAPIVVSFSPSIPSGPGLFGVLTSSARN